MKIKLDENLPSRLVSKLEALGHDVNTVRGEGLAGSADEQVWQQTRAAGRFLITQDLDFSDTRVAMLFWSAFRKCLRPRTCSNGRAAFSWQRTTNCASDALQTEEFTPHQPRLVQAEPEGRSDDLGLA